MESHSGYGSCSSDDVVQHDDQQSTHQVKPVAIIGIGCRFPGGVNNPKAFWQLLQSGQCAIGDIPADRWDIETFYDPNPARAGKSRTYRGGFIDQIDQFDAHFFGISPREAAYLDPQQRILLEVAWEALEDAGMIPERLAGSNTSVFMGGFTLDYKLLQFNGMSRNALTAHTATGVVMTMLANRLSYFFDFRGPSVSVDTACSSSLVAVDFACRTLWSGESDLALAGGVNIMIGPDFTIAESKGGFLSPTGESRAFDAAANGYVRGEGAGIVVLKLLERALADHDRIYAVIRGTAVNQDGHTNGITVPNGESQKAVARAALRLANIEPQSIDYVEAHGTGTPVGDPIEANALGDTLSSGRAPERPCVIGSVKTNIGHLEAAAGVAGLIKVALSLQHRQIPPHLNLRNPNPAIPFEQLNLRVPTALEEWPRKEGPARAAINSFGFGGTNSHAVLEEAPLSVAQQTDRPINSNRPTLLPLSARSPEALKTLAGAYQDFFHRRADGASLYDVCSMASNRRSHHNYRMALVGRSYEDMIGGLQALQNDEPYPGLSTGFAAANKRPRVVFVYSGMGPQWWGMARDLIREEPIFRQAIERCDAALLPYTGWSLLQEMLADEESSRMIETAIAQPANFALQVALTELWRSWGIEPDLIVGHSAGEVAAAYVAGGLSWDDAIKVIFHRSRLQQKTTGQGRMMAVGLSHKEVKELLRGKEERISVAAINSPSSVTLVGETVDLDEIAQVLQTQEVFCRYLHGRVPYHSHYMEPLKEELFEVLNDLRPQAPTIPLYSTVTGTLVEAPTHDAGYWWRNVRNPVLFAETVGRIIQGGDTCFLELSPHPVLASSITECLSVQHEKGTVLPSLKRKEHDYTIMLNSLGTLHTLGAPVQWSTFYPQPTPFVSLPTYQWRRERYWSEAEASIKDRQGIFDHPLLGRAVSSPRPTWQVTLNKNRLPYLNDHQVMGTLLFPGAGYAEMAFAAATATFGKGEYALEHIRFHKALFVSDDYEPIVQTTLDTQTGIFEVYSKRDEEDTKWSLHATISIRRG